MRHGSVSGWEVCLGNVVVLLRVHEVEREKTGVGNMSALVVEKSDKEDDICMAELVVRLFSRSE